MDNLIFKRRSCRHYLDKKIEEEKIHKLLSAAMIAPTACNQREWEFIVVDDKDLIEALSKSTPFTNPCSGAPLVIVPVANKDLLRSELFWQQDLGACCQNILLEAVELDLGAVWMGIAPVEKRMRYVSEVLKLPENIMPFSLISIGYHDYEVKERDLFEENKVHYNKY